MTIVAKRYAVYAIGPSEGKDALEVLLREYAQAPAAKRFAVAEAMNRQYGTAIFDRRTGRIDSGAGFEDAD